MNVHPWRFTWNLRIHPWKTKIIFQPMTFRFYVDLPGCTHRNQQLRKKKHIFLSTLEMDNIKPQRGGIFRCPIAGLLSDMTPTYLPSSIRIIGDDLKLATSAMRSYPNSPGASVEYLSSKGSWIPAKAQRKLGSKLRTLSFFSVDFVRWFSVFVMFWLTILEITLKLLRLIIFFGKKKNES